jgi:hypothetical protein
MTSSRFAAICARRDFPEFRRAVAPDTIDQDLRVQNRKYPEQTDNKRAQCPHWVTTRARQLATYI